MRKLWILFALIVILLLAFVLMSPQNLFFRQTKTNITDRTYNISPEIVLSDLSIPWEIAFLPNKEILLTERRGTLLRIGENRKIIEVKGVKHIGEGGLLGMALHPKFRENNFIYLYFTSDVDGKTENRVERYVLDLENNLLKEKKVIVDGIPGASYHDGGRIAFSPDNYLYITTGDAGNSNNAQDKNSLAGKILRVDENGDIPEDNPFGNAVYSYGHRNSQGLAWDGDGRLWATEHGRSGIQSGLDELNLIEKGKNYGWPVIQGNERREGMETPIIQSGEDTTWAPAGAVYYDGKIFFAGLRGESLYEYDINSKTLKTHFRNEFGRLRALALSENELYISTSNQDGRGAARDGDDKIIKIALDELKELTLA